MYRRFSRKIALFAALATVAAPSSFPRAADAHVTRVRAAAGPAAAVPALVVRPFASGAASGVTKPDSIVVTKQHVFIAYQNATPPTGSPKQSTVIEYTRAGRALRHFSITGRCDGMRWNPYTHTLWAVVNEDSYPGLYVIAPQFGSIRRYGFAWPTAHGGGYDDLAFSGGKAFISASNPSLNAAGVNVAPAVDSVTLEANGAVKVAPVLYGNALARDTTTNAVVRINAIDPDSMAVAPNGDIVLVDQAGTELVFIHNAGSTTQSVSRITTGTQLDDTDVARSLHGAFYIVDSAKNMTYVVSASSWPVGEVWTEAPSDSGVASFVGTLDLTTGIVTPQLVGFGSPTGLLWVDNSAVDEGQ